MAGRAVTTRFHNSDTGLRLRSVPQGQLGGSNLRTTATAGHQLRAQAGRPYKRCWVPSTRGHFLARAVRRDFREPAHNSRDTVSPIWKLPCARNRTRPGFILASASARRSSGRASAAGGEPRHQAITLSAPYEGGAHLSQAVFRGRLRQGSALSSPLTDYFAVLTLEVDQAETASCLAVSLDRGN